MKKLILLLISLFTFTVIASAQTVIICGGKYSKKYHATTDCRGLNNCKGGLYQVTKSDAINKYGRTACSICIAFTGENSDNSSAPVVQADNNPAPVIQPDNSQQQSSSVQCAGTTKAGGQCQRMTKSPNGYCWQHGGN